MKNIKILLAFLLASTFLFFLQNEAYALTCIPSIKPTYISICEDNVCKEGFEIYYEGTRGCDTIPTVKENVLNLERILQITLNQKNIQNANGIYEISSNSACFSDYYSNVIWKKPDYLNKDNWGQDCAAKVTVTKLTESTSLEVLHSYKSQWVSKELEERKLLEKDKQSRILDKILVSIIPAILIIGWPLGAIAIKPLRRHLTGLLVLAIIANLGFFILQPFFGVSLGDEYPEEILIDMTILGAILLVIILEVVFLIFRIGKRLFYRAQ